MVAGHLKQKGDYWHLVLSYIDENGVKRTPSKSSKLPIKGNKHKAEEMLLKWRLEVDEDTLTTGERNILVEQSADPYRLQDRRSKGILYASLHPIWLLKARVRAPDRQYAL